MEKILCVCVCVFYPEALEVTRLQQVPQVQDLSDGTFLLLRHSSQGNRLRDKPTHRPPHPHTQTQIYLHTLLHYITYILSPETHHFTCCGHKQTRL